MTEPTDTTETFDPFAPSEGGNKTKFGLLRLFANTVTLEGGASYTIKEVHDREGNVRAWKGKRLDKASKRTHIVMHLKADDKDGNEYEMSRDYLNSDKPYKVIVHPALQKVFGKDYPIKSYVPVQLEEVPTGESFTGRDGTQVDKTAWKVIAKFANEADLKRAEKEYFSRFTQGNGATEPAESGLSFDPNMIAVFKKHAAKGKSVAEIVDGYVDDELIAKHGKETVVKAVEAAIA